MVWTKPHISKIYEALTAIADSRIEFAGENKAKCYSSSKGKYYEIEYNPVTKEIMSNDNTAFYTGSVSYPMIAYLMLIEKVKYNENLLETLKGIYWKDINQRFNNDYDKAIEFILEDLKTKSIDIESLKKAIQGIYDELCSLKLTYSGQRKSPPTGY